MPDNVKEQLRQAYELVKAHKRQDAVAMLLPILQADENNADAWWLLANCLNEPNDVREALDNVLRLRPDHDKAKTMLAAIDARYPRPAPVPEPEPDAFGLGDSASDPFAGFGAEPAAPVNDYYEAEEPAAAPVAGDPFAASSADRFGTAQPAASAGAFGGAPEPFGGAAGAFGGPAEAFGAPSSAASNEDPFALPPSLSKAPASADPFGDPFAEPAPAAQRSKAARPAAARPSGAKPAQRKAAPAATNDLFAEESAAPRRRSATSSVSGATRGTNPLVLLLAIIGAVSICGCVVCGGLGLVAPTMLAGLAGPVLTQIDTGGFVQTLEAAGGGGLVMTLEAAGTSLEGLVPNAANAVARGSINYGEKKRDTLNAGEQHAWTLNAEANARVAITMTSTAGDGLDAFLTLLDPAGNIVVSNDDYTDGLNSQLEYQFPAGGTYTIIASSFPGTYGQYELKVERR